MGEEGASLAWVGAQFCQFHMVWRVRAATQHDGGLASAMHAVAPFPVLVPAISQLHLVLWDKFLLSPMLKVWGLLWMSL